MFDRVGGHATARHLQAHRRTAADSHTWTIEAGSYETAVEQARVETPAGSTLLYVRPER